MSTIPILVPRHLPTSLFKLKNQKLKFKTETTEGWIGEDWKLHAFNLIEVLMRVTLCISGDLEY